MRFLGPVGLLGLYLMLSGQALSASNEDPGGGQEDDRLTRLGDPEAEAEAPSIVRGSAIARAAPDREDDVAAGDWQLLAGPRLWLVDAAGREVIACDLERTTQVGERVVRCFADHLPRRLARD